MPVQTNEALSWWHIPFYYPSKNGKVVTGRMLDEHLEELKSRNNEPPFHKTLTPAKTTACAVSGLGFLTFLSGIFKGNAGATFLGFIATVAGVIGFWIDKLLGKNKVENTNNNVTDNPPVITNSDTNTDATIREPTNDSSPDPATELIIDRLLTESNDEILNEISLEDESKLISFFASIVFNNKNNSDAPLYKTAERILTTLSKNKSTTDLETYLQSKNKNVSLWAAVSLLNSNETESATSLIEKNLNNNHVVQTLLECTMLDQAKYKDISQKAYRILKSALEKGFNFQIFKALTRVPKEVYDKPD